MGDELGSCSEGLAGSLRGRLLIRWLGFLLDLAMVFVSMLFAPGYRMVSKGKVVTGKNTKINDLKLTLGVILWIESPKHTILPYVQSL